MSESCSIQLVAVGAATGIAILGLWLVGARLKAKEQRFGPNSLKALGLVLFPPLLLIVAVIVPDFRSETVAALMGTVAGHVLSDSGRIDS